MDDLDRLYDRLTANIREGFPHLVDRAFQLGDIGEHLVPYRLNRRELGFDSVRQYELALMRLASGERGYLRADATVQDAFRRALAAPEPDAALLRDHARASVALPEGARQEGTRSGTGPVSASTAAAAGLAPQGAPASSAPRVAEPPAGGASGPPPAVPSLAATGFIRSPAMHRDMLPATPPTPPIVPPVPLQQPVVPAALELDPLELPPSYDLDTPQWADRMAPEPQRASAPRDAMPPTGAALEPRPGPTIIGGPCRYCGQALPEGRAVTFCPHCGQNVTVRHCPACSTELEVGWHFCITCGRAMDDAAGSATER